MDYEKKYKEALEIAQKLYQDCPNGKNDRLYHTTDLEKMFPELRESEDEKIRKELIDIIAKSPITFTFEDKNKVLAWLEKQGEKKPADKVEPKFKVKYAGSEYNVFETKDIAGVIFYGIEDEPNHIDYAIKENGSPYPTKPAVFTKQKPKRMISAETKESLLHDKYEGLTDFERTLADICIGWIGQELGWEQYIKDNADVLLKIAIKKFNSIQDAPFEQKSAWSEEDERHLNTTIAYLKDAQEFKKTAENCIDWLNSLKQRIGGEQ